MMTTCLSWDLLICLSLPSKGPWGAFYLPSHFLDKKAEVQGKLSAFPRVRETWLALGQDQLVQCAWIYSDPCSILGVGLLPRYTADTYCVIHCSQNCFVASNSLVSIISGFISCRLRGCTSQSESHQANVYGNLFTLVWKCIFFNWNFTFLKYISRILRTLCSFFFSLCFNYLFLFCGGDGAYGLIPSSIHSPNIYWAPIVFTLMPNGLNQWWDSWMWLLLPGSSESSYASWSLSSFDSQPGVCLLFHMISQGIQLKNSLHGKFLPGILLQRSSFHKKAPLLSLYHMSSSFPT